MVLAETSLCKTSLYEKVLDVLSLSAKKENTEKKTFGMWKLNEKKVNEIFKKVSK